MVWTGIEPGTGCAEEIDVALQHHNTGFSAETAKEAWDGPAIIYAARSFAKQMELRKQLSYLCKEPSAFLARYTAWGTSLQKPAGQSGYAGSQNSVSGNLHAYRCQLVAQRHSPCCVPCQGLRGLL